jgi:histidine triad (HIT) family protein
MADDIFCQIVAGRIPAEIVYQDENMVAFKDIHPKASVHVLLVPRKHIPSLAELKAEDAPVLAHLMQKAGAVAQKLGVGKNFKLVINTGPEAGQVVMHLHIHLLAGKGLPQSP